MSVSLNGRRHFWNFSVSEPSVSNNEDPVGKNVVYPFRIFRLNLNPETTLLTVWCTVFSVMDMVNH